MPLAAGPLIDLKPYVDMVVVHHSVRPELSTSNGNTKPGNVQERPMVSLHVSSTHKANHPVEFHDDYPGGQDMQWALNIIKVDKTIQATSMSIRFNVHRDILTNYYKNRMVHDMAANKTPTAISEKLLTNIRSFQKFINRTFAPCQEDISLTSTAATFLLGGGLIRKSPHDSSLRFERALPYTKGQTLLRMIMSHQWAQDGFLMAIDLKDLHQGELYQIQAS